MEEMKLKREAAKAASAPAAEKGTDESADGFGKALMRLCRSFGEVSVKFWPG